MDILKVLKESFSVYASNIVAYVVGFIIAVIGSFLIVTLPPLAFGMAYMCWKGAKGEKVEFKDVFTGFSYFVQSWMYFIFIAIVLGLPLLIAIGAGVALGFTLVISLIAIAASLIWVIAVAVSQVYAIPIIVSKKAGAIEGITSSAKLAMANIVPTILFVLALFVVNMVLSLIPVIGTLISNPLTMIAANKALMEVQGEKKV